MTTDTHVNDQLPRILCVDDEPAVLAGLRRQLFRDATVCAATSGEEALALLEADPGYSVLISDMRMPGMDGATLLAEARARRPETVRVLLTGQADLDAAIAAVNEGNLFRFLLKPCPSPVLRRALADAVGFHRSLTAERQLLEQTLHGAVAALVDALALANPTAFARATRIQALVRQLLAATTTAEAWQIELAAMLSQIGTVVLPEETLDKLHAGLTLTEEERAKVDQLPELADRILAPIPRLEEIRRIIRDQRLPFERLRHGGERTSALGARMLRLAADLDALESAGIVRADALAAMAAQVGVYDPALLAQLAAPDAGEADNGPQIVTVTPDELRAGAMIARDVLDGAGRLIIGRGFTVTESLLDRIANWRGPAIQEPIFVYAEAS